MTNTFQILSDFVFTKNYARWLENEKRRETWSEAVNRCKQMMLTKYAHIPSIHPKIEWAYNKVLNKEILGSQRALQFGGEPILKKNARIYNCTASYCDRIRFFQECLWLLLNGAGTGFSVQKHHVDKLPKLQPLRNKKYRTFKIPDSIEGWADAVGILLTTYMEEPVPGFEYWLDFYVTFDYSLIRPEGSRLGSGIGKAPGPKALNNGLDKIEALLIRAAKEGNKLRPIHAHDIIMHLANIPLAGGVRRSSCISIFSKDDKEMLLSKTGNWIQENPQRAQANNSALCLRNNTSLEEYQEIMQYTQEWGEPGVIWTDSLESLFNPCCEINMFGYDVVDEKLFNEWKKNHAFDPITVKPSEIGLRSGWQGCNLTTINCASLRGSNEQKKADFIDRARAASFIGTLQAGFTDLTYLGEASENIFKREALLGVSMTGIMDNADIATDPDVLKQAVEVILQENEETTKIIGINAAARTTCLKPEGTGTLILESSAHGCHPHHYVRYLKCVQTNKKNTVYQHFRKHNPQACESSFWAKDDDVVYFPIEVPPGAKTKNQISAIEFLSVVKNIQTNWINTGKRLDKCVMPWLCHNTSNTTTVNKHEWPEVIRFIYDNRQYFAGISFVQNNADKDYPQAPFCAVYLPSQILKEYGEGALYVYGLIEQGIELFGHLYKACFAILGNSPPTTKEQEYYLNKANKYTKKYFEGDIKRLTYCMKDVYNRQKWQNLVNTMVSVDYTTMVEEQNTTHHVSEVACSGNACLII